MGGVAGRASVANGWMHRASGVFNLSFDVGNDPTLSRDLLIMAIQAKRVAFFFDELRGVRRMRFVAGRARSLTIDHTVL